MRRNGSSSGLASSKQMDALESVFVPYRDVLAPKPAPSAPSTWRWLTLAVVALLVGAAVWMMTMRSKPSPLQWISEAGQTAWSPQAAVQKAVVAPTSTALGPPLASIPKSISLIRGGASDASTAPTTPHELAKQVGLAVKQTLLTFPSLTPEIVASIVQHTVRSILDTSRPKAAPAQPPKSTPPEPAPEVPQARGGRMSVRGLPVPFVDEDDSEAQEAGSKQKKINADSDPAVLRLMKERGLDVKNG